MAFFNNSKYFLSLFILLSLTKCSGQTLKEDSQEIITGAERTDKYLPLLKGKSVAMLVNHTSLVNGAHLLDTLLSHGVNVVKAFAPEHGFRGDMADGEQVKDDIDIKTGIPIVSLYGKNKKPSAEQLSDVDLVIYDIQDVGARFYTFISAMHYAMEACAENDVSMMILDRPNPNGHYVDGPVLNMTYQSYVGMHEIPIVYGMTSGELSQMIVGEKWLNSTNALDLTVIPLLNWDHQKFYELPVKPSPNLPNQQSILLYPSLCLFEGTTVSVGRGTKHPFQVLGIPDSTAGEFNFTPVSIPTASKYPKHENITCYGIDLRTAKALNRLDLSYLIQFYQLTNPGDKFFRSYFTKLAGTEELQTQIMAGLSEEEIRKSWEPALTEFKAMRKKYLLYED